MLARKARLRYKFRYKFIVVLNTKL
jgi:hypothetical protein